MSDSDTKARRLLQIEALLLAHPEGLTQAEIARRLGVNRSTIHRYLPDLTHQFPIYEEDDGRLTIDRSASLVDVSFTLNEALAVHLAARLLATRMDRQNPHAASALRKLGIALERLAPRISRHLQQSADVMDDAAQRHDPAYIGVLEKLALAWAEERKVRVWHRHEASGLVHEYIFSPYFIEPYAVGQSTHVIGWREPPGAQRTFKIERIERAELLRERYSIPPDFDPRLLLADAWGIWYSESEAVEVALKFSPRAARRVRETRWHRSETIEDLPDGGLIWRARLAEPREMLPWVRGWGADVEVLAPTKLREALKDETRRLAALYQVIQLTGSTISYYAHARPDRPEYEWQPLKEHLLNTADLAEKLGADAGVSALARTAALLHDIGKYSQAFQARLRGSKRHVDHATAGAREILRLFPGEPHKDFAELLSYCIAGHHSGLPDYGDPTDVGESSTLLARRDKKQLEDYSAFRSEIEVPIFEPRNITPIPGYQYFSISFLARMVYSVLVDADWLETEIYMEESAKPRGDYLPIGELRQHLDAHLKQYENPTSAINHKRTETLKACIAKAANQPGIFTLTVPTGGGKTLASMAFALYHAIANDLKRVIYVIPFTSIIEQNAGIFKDIFGQQNVLEHHSNFDWDKIHAGDDNETNQLYEKLKLATENWDIPIIVTTNVQFFETLFANKKSRARKLHNIAKSVLIFDEAQLLPREYLRPCLLAVRELVQNYGASAVFCTATQPEFQHLLPGVSMMELAPDPQALFNFYKHVHIRPAGIMPDDELVERLHNQHQVLCIVNTRRHAKGLFDLLDEPGRYHLSTLMCPFHRKQTIAVIKERLQSDQVCRVVSTQVLEAGVDLDFRVGYRALAGLDSIIQAAGRVNREHRLPSAELFVFEPHTEFIKRTPAFINQTASASQAILREYANNPDSLEAIHAYFTLLDTLQDTRRSTDVKNILHYLNKSGFEFAKASENFRIIEDPTVSMVIPFDEKARSLLQQMRYSPYPGNYVRRLQNYTVNLYQREFESLQSKGAVETYHDLYFVLTNMEYYDQETGVLLPADDGGEAIFFD